MTGGLPLLPEGVTFLKDNVQNLYVRLSGSRRNKNSGIDNSVWKAFNPGFLLYESPPLMVPAFLNFFLSPFNSDFKSSRFFFFQNDSPGPLPSCCIKNDRGAPAAFTIRELSVGSRKAAAPQMYPVGPEISES